MNLLDFLKSKSTLETEISKIEGIRLTEKFTKKIAIFESSFSVNNIELFVNTLHKFKTAFTFHDTLYPSPSDPGAYISYFLTPNSDHWKMSLGNHGWSAGIYTIENEVIYKQLTNLIQSSLINEIQIEGVVTFSHYAEKNDEENKKQNEYLLEIHKSTLSFLERNVLYQFHKQKGFPKLTDNQQCELLINSDYSIIQNLFPEVKNEPFPLEIIKHYITIDKQKFAVYFKQTEYIEKNVQQYLSNTQSDGTWVIKLKDRYKLIFQEHGNIYGHQIFDNLNELEERLISLLYTQFGD